MYNMDKHLSEKDIATLRLKGIITQTEIAFKSGNILIAEDIVTKHRRVVSSAGVMLEANQKILLD